MTQTIPIAGKTYRVEVIRYMPPAGVAFLIPCHEGVELTLLAVDAINAFTAETPREIWVIDNASSRMARERLQDNAKKGWINLILNHTRPQPWWRRQIKFGSWANGVALEIALKAIPEPRPRAFFVMHNDALPIRAGWLTDLVRSDPAAIAFGVKEDPHPARIHAMHESGFFVPAEIAASTSFLPELPHLDAGNRITAEVRARGEKTATTPWHPHRVTFRVGLREPVQRPELCARCPRWLRDIDCDVSTFTPGGEPFYVHKGGGSAMSQQEINQWVMAAREALGL